MPILGEPLRQGYKEILGRLEGNMSFASQADLADKKITFAELADGASAVRQGCTRTVLPLICRASSPSSKRRNTMSRPTSVSTRS